VYAQGSKLGVVSAKDLVAILASNPRMKPLLCETANAFVQRETGSTAGLQRAVEAATAPSLGQQMLQKGSRDAIANGISREVLSVLVDAEGKQVAEQVVERGVLLPNGQGVSIQQAVQQVIVPVDSGLGKRKVSDEREKVEIRLLNLQCSQLEIENEQKKNDNRFSTVTSFSKTMELLDPQWRNDKRLVLQATDYLKNTILIGSSAQQIENGPAQSESISIGSVAFEMGISLPNGKAKAAGKIAVAAYKEKYNEPPSKHNQTIGGNVILVNSYTQRDRDLLQTAIKTVA